MNPTFHETDDDKYFKCGHCLERHDKLVQAANCCSKLGAPDDDFSTGRQPQKAPFPYLYFERKRRETA